MAEPTQQTQPAATPRRTRPRDRRDRIVAAATELFCRDGYPAVSMADVAEAVGVQPSALYRHFAGKQDLLLAAVQTSLESGASILTAPHDDLDSLLLALATGALDHRNLGVLWQRESRHLSAEQRSDLVHAVRDARQALLRAVESERAPVDSAQTEFVAGGVLSVLISVSYQRAEMPRPAYVALLHDLVCVVACSELPALGRQPEVRPAGMSLSSRREALLAAAVVLFAERGFDEVGVDDIAAVAGIAPPSFYHHFKGKSDVLWAILVRGDQAIRTDLSRALRKATDPVDALRRAMRSYIALALDSPELIEAMVWQVPHLLADRRIAAIEIQRDLVGEWLALLAGARPDLGRAAARVRVQAALTVVNDTAMTRRLRMLPGAADALGVVVDGVLGLPPAEDQR